MFGMSDAHHFRKMVAGFCMVAAPLLALVGFIIHPASHSNEAAQVREVAANMDAWYIAHLLLFVSLILALPAVLGLMHMLRRRETALGHLGGGLGLTGLVAIAGVIGMEMVIWQMGAGPQGEMTSLLQRVNDTAGIVLPFYLGALLFGLGYVALGVGLYRARATASWFAACLMIGGILFDIAFLAQSVTLAIIAAALFVVGQGAIGLMVWRETDDAWERTPEYPGFRPLVGAR